MAILTDIPYTPDIAALMEQLHISPGSEDEASLKELADLAQRNARPKVIYREVYVDGQTDDTVTIDGVTFTSEKLRMNLQQVHRVFPFVATCGREMDDVFDAKGDFLLEYWWDGIKERALRTALDFFKIELQRRFQIKKTASMSPGSGDAHIWPIQQQRPLFDLLGSVFEQVGVELTDSCLMVPNKTISGIRYASNKDFRTCEVCRRENCPSRSAAFDAQQWQELNHPC